MQKKKLYVNGMHCNSCDILVKNTLCEFKNIENVFPDHSKAEAEVEYSGKLDTNAINQKLKKYGYSLSDRPVALNSRSKNITDAAIIGIIIVIAYYMASTLGILPEFATPSTLSIPGALILGLIASTSTCMATSGALFMGTVGKMKQGSQMSAVMPAVLFNTGRVLSYGLFGFIAGVIGKSFSANAMLSTILSVVIAAFMIIIALDMLKIIELTALLGSGIGKNIFASFQKRFAKRENSSAFFLGASTYFLPCGFTQTTQLYAISLANPWGSALVMMTFALGTTPALLALGFASKYTEMNWYKQTMKVLGVIILLLGVSYSLNVINLLGVNTSFLTSNDSGETVKIENGKQIVKMDVDARGYSPSSFTIKSGVPVEWKINGINTFGCQSTLQMPKAGISTTIIKGENTLSFTPKEKGIYAFSCSMGMYKGTFTVI